MFLSRCAWHREAAMVPWLCGRFREILPEPGRNLRLLHKIFF